MKPTRTVFAVGLACVFLAGCSTSSRGVPGVLNVGTHLVATVQVGSEIEQVEFGDDTTSALEIELLEIHWTGNPLSAVAEPPKVAEGDVLAALDPPGFTYELGHTYVATLSFGPSNTGYDWWLNTGIADDGSVIQSGMDVNDAEDTLRLLRETRPELASNADLLAALAEEWQARHNARDRGNAEVDQPAGPLLEAMFTAAAHVDKIDGQVSPVERFVATPADRRVLPTDAFEDQNLLELSAPELGVEWAELETMVLHGDRLDGTPTIGLWFRDIGRTAETFVNHSSGVTIMSSVVPEDTPFEIVVYPPIVESSEGSANATGPRTWDSSIGIVDRTYLQPLESDDTNSEQGPIDRLYLVITLTDGSPAIERLSETGYFERVTSMEDVLRPSDSAKGDS